MFKRLKQWIWRRQDAEMQATVDTIHATVGMCQRIVELQTAREQGTEAVIAYYRKYPQDFLEMAVVTREMGIPRDWLVPMAEQVGVALP